MDNVVNFNYFGLLHSYLNRGGWAPLSHLHQMIEEFGYKWARTRTTTVVSASWDYSKPCWVIRSMPAGAPHSLCTKYYRSNGRSYEYFPRLEYVDGYCELPAHKPEEENTALQG